MAHDKDLEGHLKSIEEDMEYWRTKRLEPRIFRLLRKGEITFSDLLRAAHTATATTTGGTTTMLTGSMEEGRGRGSGEETTAKDEDRIEALEMRLGEFIRGIEVATSIIGKMVLVEESRDEAGVYDEKLRFAHRRLAQGSIKGRISELEGLLDGEIALMHALLSVLTAKGLVAREKVEEMLSAPYPPRYENGARIVARAWLDPEFKARLVADAKVTLRELGFALNRTPKLVVLEDTESVRNVIVCTLCSCYPYELLGNPPWWYKHDSYKEAIVREPRKTLALMFRLSLPERIEVRVYDSTSDVRYMVLPRRPEGSMGLGEEELADLVTQDSLIGVGETLKPALPERGRPGTG
jgi:nitrile hydratase